MDSTQHDPEQIWTSVLTNLLNDPTILNQHKGFLAGAMPKGMIGDSIYVLAAPSELHRRHRIAVISPHLAADTRTRCLRAGALVLSVEGKERRPEVRTSS